MKIKNEILNIYVYHIHFHFLIGLFTAPIWAWQNTFLAELVPKGKENLFFGLFGVVNKGSAWIGPIIIVNENRYKLMKQRYIY